MIQGESNYFYQHQIICLSIPPMSSYLWDSVGVSKPWIPRCNLKTDGRGFPRPCNKNWSTMKRKGAPCQNTTPIRASGTPRNFYTPNMKIGFHCMANGRDSRHSSKVGQSWLTTIDQTQFLPVSDESKFNFWYYILYAFTNKTHSLRKRSVFSPISIWRSQHLHNGTKTNSWSRPRKPCFNMRLSTKHSGQITCFGVSVSQSRQWSICSPTHSVLDYMFFPSHHLRLLVSCPPTCIKYSIDKNQVVLHQLKSDLLDLSQTKARLHIWPTSSSFPSTRERASENGCWSALARRWTRGPTSGVPCYTRVVMMESGLWSSMKRYLGWRNLFPGLMAWRLWLARDLPVFLRTYERCKANKARPCWAHLETILWEETLHVKFETSVW